MPLWPRPSPPPSSRCWSVPPPELAADVTVSGILLTGGGSLLRGMDELLTARTGITARRAEDPLQAVALGLELTLPHLSRRQEGVLNLSQRRQLTG